MKEIWNLYDSNLELTNKTISRDEEVPEGYYHLSIEVWIINNKNQLLLLRSSFNYSKIYPGAWKCLTGNICTKENAVNCTTKSAKNKIGLDLDTSNMIILGPHKRDKYRYAYYTCIIKGDIDINDLNLDEKLFIDAKYVDKNKLIEMCNNGEVAYYLIERINNEVIKYMEN